MKFKLKNEKITVKEFNDFENLLDDLKLPIDYKQHMLDYNGGYPEGDYVCFKHPERVIKVDYLHPIKYADSTMEYYLMMRNVLPSNQIEIGSIRGGSICVSLDESDYGSISIYYEDVIPEKIASSFTEFINGLFEADPETYF